MPIKITVKADFSKLERRLKALSGDGVERCAVQAVNNAAFAARKRVIDKLPTTFDRPTPLTMHSVLVDKATFGSGGAIVATVRIRDEALKGTAPSKYLLHQTLGGPRPMKASERALQIRGLLTPAQQIVPGPGATLDQYGGISGGSMKQILSRIGASGDQGYQSNATSTTKRKLKRRNILVTRRTGTEFFIGRSKRDGEPLGIYKLVGRGQVKAVLWFVDRRPQYRERFPFADMVREASHEAFKDEFVEAIFKRLRGE